MDWSEYENDIKVDGSVSTDDFQYLEFTANMKINIYDSGMLDDSGTYKIDGTTLTLTGIGDEVSEFDIATLTNTDLILVGEDSYEEGGSIWKEVVTVTLERRN